MKNHMILAVFLFLSIILCPDITLSQSSVRHPLPSGLLFSTWYGRDNGGLFYVDPETLEMTALLVRDVDRAFWSPDGSQIAFVESTQRICIYDFEHGNRQCTDLEMPLWEHGGIFWGSYQNRIWLLLMTPLGLPQLAIMDASSIEVTLSHLVPLNEETLLRIYWSPTGEYLAYQTFTGQDRRIVESDPVRLYLLDVDTGETQRVTDQSHYGCVAWSEDGERIGVVAEEWPDPEFLVRLHGKIVIYDLNGAIVSEVQPRYQDQDVSGCRIAWSHDRTRLAFFGYARNQYGSWDFQAFVTQIDSGDTYKLFWPGFRYYPDVIEWSYDDTHLLVGARYADFADIRVISLDGWERVYTINGVGFFYPSWRPPTDQ